MSDLDHSGTIRLAVLGDLHGHLQLGLCTLARWQRESGIPISAVLLAGDVGTFAEEGQLDSATRSHARDNPCELEFLRQWASWPQAPWIGHIFLPGPEGLGLTCPVVMVHGNHEGFAHMERLYSRRRRPDGPVDVGQLPEVDAGGHLRLLPSGWVVRLGGGGGITVGGVGGMEPGQRRAKYHPMAYVDDDAVARLLDARPLDVVLTHQGPAAVQGDHGSPTLDLLLGRSRLWFHGHSTPVRDVTEVGETAVVPLGDVAFTRQGSPGLEGWCLVDLHADGSYALHREAPPFWREVRRGRWGMARNGELAHPELLRFL